MLEGHANRLLPLLNARLTFLMSSLNVISSFLTRMWADAQRNGRRIEYRWRRLFNARCWSAVQ